MDCKDHYLIPCMPIVEHLALFVTVFYYCWNSFVDQNYYCYQVLLSHNSLKMDFL